MSRAGLDITRTVDLKSYIQVTSSCDILGNLQEDGGMEERVLEEAEDALGGDLAGLVTPGGHQEGGGTGEDGRETAHLPTLSYHYHMSLL